MVISTQLPDGDVAEAGRQDVYRALRRQILNLDLEPGSELDEISLSRRFGVSRTPVREALIRLSSDGLVAMQRGRGARVAPLDLRYLRDFFEGLDILQRAVTRLAAIRREVGDLEAIEAHMLAFEVGAAALDSDTVNETNYHFHLAIAAAAKSAHLGDSYGRLMAEGLRLSYVCFAKEQRTDARLNAHLGNIESEHREMYRAIRARDADAAERVAGAHVELFKTRMLNVLVSFDLAKAVSVALDDGDGD